MIFCKNFSQDKGKLYWVCCLKSLLAQFFLMLALLSLVGAWMSRGGIWWGWDGLTWYWNALVLGVLALGLRIVKYHENKSSGCGCGQCADGKCCMREGRVE